MRPRRPLLPLPRATVRHSGGPCLWHLASIWGGQVYHASAAQLSALSGSTATGPSSSKDAASRQARGGARPGRGKVDDVPEVVRAARAGGLTVAGPAKPEDRYATVNGVRLHYLDWGNERLSGLLFLHGFAQQAHSWDFAALALRHRFHAVSLDLRGHGDSGWSPDGHYNLERHAADVAAFIPAAGLQQPVICGLSMGGRIAYTYAAGHPDGMRALIVAESAPETQEAGRRAVTDFTSAVAEFDAFEDIVARVLAYNPHRTPEMVRGSLRHSVRQRPDGKWTWKYDPAIRPARAAALSSPFKGEEPALSLPKGQGAGETRRPAARSDSPEAQWEALSKVRCPKLFVIGADSQMIAPDKVQRMLQAVPGSTAETVERAGHLVAGDNPVGFDAAVRRFLDRLPGKARAGPLGSARGDGPPPARTGRS